MLDGREGVGTGDAKTTTLYAAVTNVRTSPSATPLLGKAHCPLGLLSGRPPCGLGKVHPSADGRPYFQLLDEPVTLEMAIVVTPPKGDEVVTPLRLTIDPFFLRPSSIAELDSRFRSDQNFYNRCVAAGGPAARNMVFGKSDLPRTPEGYVLCSFVTSFFRGKQEVPGNVLKEPGLRDDCVRPGFDRHA